MTRRFLQTLFALGMILTSFILTSCSENLYDTDDTPKLTQYVYLVPNGFSGDISQRLAPIQSTSINLGKSAKFAVIYSLDGVPLSSDEASKYYSSVLWEIDDEYYNIDIFRYTFMKSGVINGRLRTIDEFLDTLTTEFTVRVNTPETFTLDFPYNGYNQAEPLKYEETPLRWTITGIDPWESAVCDVFVSTSLDSLFNDALGSVDCYTDANLWGPLVKDATESQTFYWAVKYTIYSYGSVSSENTSPIYHFSTKLADDSVSILRVPIHYNNFENEAANAVQLKTVAYVVNAMGDTLKTYTGSSQDQELYYKLTPQTGVKVYFKELSKKDYTTDSILVDLPKGTVVVTDTVYFNDRVAPQIQLANNPVQLDSGIVFNLYDDGSGIDQATLTLTTESVSATWVLEGSTLKISYPDFKTDCTTSACNLLVSGTDYAGNKIPETKWMLVNNSGWITLMENK